MYTNNYISISTVQISVTETSSMQVSIVAFLYVFGEALTTNEKP